VEIAPEKEDGRNEEEMFPIEEEKEQGEEEIGKDLRADIEECAGGSGGKEKDENGKKRHFIYTDKSQNEKSEGDNHSLENEKQIWVYFMYLIEDDIR